MHRVVERESKGILFDRLAAKMDNTHPFLFPPLEGHILSFCGLIISPLPSRAYWRSPEWGSRVCSWAMCHCEHHALRGLASPPLSVSHPLTWWRVMDWVWSPGKHFLWKLQLLVVLPTFLTLVETLQYISCSIVMWLGPQSSVCHSFCLKAIAWKKFNHEGHKLGHGS